MNKGCKQQHKLINKKWTKIKIKGTLKSKIGKREIIKRKKNILAQKIRDQL